MSVWGLFGNGSIRDVHWLRQNALVCLCLLVIIVVHSDKPLTSPLTRSEMDDRLLEVVILRRLIREYIQNKLRQRGGGSST